MAGAAIVVVIVAVLLGGGLQFQECALGEECDFLQRLLSYWDLIEDIGHRNEKIETSTVTLQAVDL